jgi:putative ABC transport system ATP-binding protein
MAIATTPDAAAVVPGTVLSAADVTRQYGEGDSAVHALRGVSLDIPHGQFAAVMGPSGSGKSTLMHILAGLDTPTAGQVWIGQEEITGMDDDELTLLRRRSIGFIFQFFNLLPMLTAQQNVVLPLSIAGEDIDAEWVDEVMEKVGLADRRTHRPSEMSGGQQQRVAIARGLVSRPTILFADEPTGNLDSTMSEEILQALRDSVDSYGQTTMMVTHEASAAAVADRIVFLADGETVEDEYGLDEHAVLGTMERLAHR